MSTNTHHSSSSSSTTSIPNSTYNPTRRILNPLHSLHPIPLNTRTSRSHRYCSISDRTTIRQMFCMNAGGLNSQQNSIHAVSAAANDKMPKIGKRLGLVFMRKDVFLFDVIRAHNHRVGERGVNVDALHGVGFQDPAADDEAVKAMDV